MLWPIPSSQMANNCLNSISITFTIRAHAQKSDICSSICNKKKKKKKKTEVWSSSTLKYVNFHCVAPYSNKKEKETHELIFSWLSMASGIALGRVRKTTTMTAATESRNIVAILRILGSQRHAALLYRLLLWYWTSMLWSIDTCQNKVHWPVLHDRIAGLSVQIIEIKCFF